MAWNQPGGHNPWGGDDRERRSDNNSDPLKKIHDIFGGSPRPNPEGMGKFGAMIAAAVAVVVLATGIYQVDEQERGLVLRLGAFHEIVGPGIHWNPPFVDMVIKENVTAQRSYSTQGAMLTADENIVEVQLSVQYNIGDLRKFLLSIRQPEHALSEAADSALRHAVGSSKMDDVLTTGRDKIAADVQSRLQRYLETYQTGIEVTKVNVERTQPPVAVQAAFDDVIKAREDEQRVQNEAQTYANTVIPQARGLSKRLHEEALAYRDQVIARAEGEAHRFQALLAEYQKAPEVTRQRMYLETVQNLYSNNGKILLDAKNSNPLLYLPVDQLGRKSAAPDSTTTNTPNTATVSQQQLDNLVQQVAEQVRAQQPQPTSARARREARP